MDMDKEEPVGTKQVYAAIAAVGAELAEQGISKTHRNEMQRYDFRGIDDVYNALGPLLARHRLTILPRMTERQISEHETRGGGTLFRVAVRAEFDFVSVEDGSSHTVVMFGEASDTGDKATNKAMSAAYKYAAFQVFCIPVDVDDGDAETPPEVRPQRPIEKPASAPKTPAAEGDACPECGSKLRLRTAKATGEQFWGCTDYPNCRYTKPHEEEKPASAPKTPAAEGDACPECGSKLRLRTAKATGEQFWGCGGYPNCRYTKPASVLTAEEPPPDPDPDLEFATSGMDRENLDDFSVSIGADAARELGKIIGKACRARNYDPIKLRKELCKKYGAGKLSDFSEAQAEEIRAKLDDWMKE